MSCSHHNQLSALAPACYQGSWTRIASAEKVATSVTERFSMAQRRLAVQPWRSEVGRLKPAWILASSNLLTSPSHTHAHMRVYAHVATWRIVAIGKHWIQVRQVRRLDRMSIDAAYSRLTI